MQHVISIGVKVLHQREFFFAFILRMTLLSSRALILILVYEELLIYFEKLIGFLCQGRNLPDR